jgi:iron complex outermembrane receptor protein
MQKCSLALCALLLVTTAAYARADEPKPQLFDIGPQGLPSALATFARQSHEEILFAPELVATKRTAGVKGTMEPLVALRVLLRDTGLPFSSTPSGAILVGNPSNATQSTSSSSYASADPPTQDTKEAGKKSSQDFRMAQVDQGQNSQSHAIATGTSTDSSSTTGLQEIVVTAQKRPERLKDVPIAVSVFNQESVDKLAITGIDSLSREVPSLSFSIANTGGGEPIVAIRGITTAYGIFPAVSVYIDDTPLDTRTDVYSGSTLIDLFDLDRIEVLRGPQGTLFGASSMGGAIRVITAQPDTKQFSTRWELGWADNEAGGMSYVTNGAVNVPLSDTLAVRFVATHSQVGGWIDRSMPTDYQDITAEEPITRRNENVSGRTSLRLAMRWTPDDIWTITPSLIYQNAGLQGQNDYYPDAGRFVRPHLLTDEGSFNTSIASLKVEADLGWSTITSATGYLDKSTHYLADYGEFGEEFAIGLGLGPIIPKAYLDDPVTYHQFTEELRLTSPNTGRLRWVVGAYFNNTTQTDFEYINSAAYLPLGTSNAFSYDAPVHDHQTAEFGELTIVPLQQFEITGGFRAYQFRTTEVITQTGLVAGADVPRTTATASGVNPKLSATFKLNPSVNIYATAAEGFRAGGPNAGLFAVPGCTFLSVYKPTYDPDTVWNYEVGTKASALDGRVSFNAAAFQMNWHKFLGEVNSSCGAFTANVGTARSRGVELETNASVNTNVSLHASFAYDDARIQSLNPGFAGAGVGVPGGRLANVPQVQFTIGAEFVAPLNSNWTAFARPNLQYVGSAPTSYTYVAPEATRPAYSNLDLTAGVQKDSWELSLYVRNLTNSLQIVSVNVPILDGPQFFTNPPRTFGISIRSRY